MRSYITTDTGRLHNECGERDREKKNLYVSNTKVTAISMLKVKFNLEKDMKAQR
jgi:hypothetical protein